MSKHKAVDIPLLRNRLQYECSELKCITEQELVECKWQVKKKVYSQLFSMAPTLHDHNEHLLDLLDERNKELSAAKLSSKVIDRNVRLEEEREFRTKYLSLVLDGLQKLKWPPSQEAFSDPMDLLFNDPVSVVDSFKFLLDVAVPQASSRFGSRDSSLLEQQLVDSFDSFNSGVSATKRLSPKDKKQNKVLPSTTNDPSFELSYSNISALNNSMDGSSAFSGGSREYEYITTKPVDISKRSMASFDASIDDRNVPLTSRSTRSNMSTASINSTSSARSYYTVNGTRVTKSNAKYEFSMKAFEILQTQNDLLRRKLKIVMDSIAARDHQEAKMSAIMAELKSSIRDMVEISGNSSSNSSSSRRHSVDSIQNDLNRNPYLGLGKGGSNGSSSSAGDAKADTSDEMVLFAEEVQREEQRRLAEKNKALGVHSVLPTEELPGGVVCPHCKTVIVGESSKQKKSDVTSSGVKSGTKAKPLGSFAKSHSANASMISSSSSASTSGTTQSPPPQFKAPTPRQDAATAAAADNSSSSALWSRLQSRLQSIESQWTEAVRQTRSHAGAAVAPHPLSEQYLRHHSSSGRSPHGVHTSPSHGASGMMDEEEEEVLGQQSASEAMVHQVIGVSRRSTSVGVGRQDSEESHGLDLTRVRLLQRDLVGFAEAAAACVAAMSVNDDGDGTVDTPRTTSRGGGASGSGSTSGVYAGAAKNKQRLMELQDSAWLLLLHLSSLAPIAPLSSESPYQSHLTGLEAFTKEVIQLFGNKGNKNNLSRLQSLADRAKSEQVSVIRALTAYQSVVKQWCDYSQAAAPRLDQLGAKYSHCINRTNNDIDKWSSSLTDIVNAFNEAEAARIVLEDLTGGTSSGSSTGRRVPQSPLNYLIKGSHGREIGTLLGLLRDHRDDLYQIPVQLDLLSEKLRSELKGDLDTLRRVSEDHRQAASRCERLTESDGVSASSSIGVVSSEDKSNRSSRRRAEALSSNNSSSAGMGGRNRQSSGGGVYSTPKGKQQQPPAWNSSTVLTSGSAAGGGTPPPRPPFDTSYL